MRTRWPAGPKDLPAAATWPGRGSDEAIEDRDRLERGIRAASAAALACPRVDPSARPSPVRGRARACSGLRMTLLGGGFSIPLRPATRSLPPCLDGPTETRPAEEPAG